MPLFDSGGEPFTQITGRTEQPSRATSGPGRPVTKEARVGKVGGNEFGGGRVGSAPTRVMEPTLRSLPFRRAHVVLSQGDIESRIMTSSVGPPLDRPRSADADQHRSPRHLSWSEA
jgi:hypothetical protein